MGIALAVGILLILVAFVSGYWSRNEHTFTIGSPGNDECSRACDKLRDRRGALCATRDAINRLPQELASLTTQVGLAQLAAVGLLAAAVAAAVIPLFGQFVATSLASAYAAAQLYVVFLLGQHAQTADTLRGHNQALPQLVQADAEALAEVRRICPPEEADRCVGSLRAC